MHAIKLLLNEHQRVRKMLVAITESQRATTKKRLFHDLGNDLIIHEEMEEKVFYPYLKKNNKELSSTIKHLTQEEQKAAKEIQKLSKISSENEWDEKFAHFKEAVEHHATEEETKLFPKVEKIFNEEELKEIGKDMQEFKRKGVSLID